MIDSGAIPLLLSKVLIDSEAASTQMESSKGMNFTLNSPAPTPVRPRLAKPSAGNSELP
ncbi:hypothetical protein D3C73_1525220 [compost metagenome]